MEIGERKFYQDKNLYERHVDCILLMYIFGPARITTIIYINVISNHVFKRKVLWDWVSLEVRYIRARNMKFEKRFTQHLNAGTTSLMAAMMTASVEIVKMLLQSGVNVANAQT